MKAEEKKEGLKKGAKSAIDPSIFVYEFFFSIGTIMVLIGYIHSKLLTLAMGLVSMFLSLYIHGARIKARKTTKEIKSAANASKKTDKKQIALFPILFLLGIFIFLFSIFYSLWFTSILSLIFLVFLLLASNKNKQPHQQTEQELKLKKQIDSLKEQERKAREKEREEKKHLNELKRRRREELKINQRQERIKRREQRAKEREQRAKKRKEEKELKKLESAKKKLERMEKIKEELIKQKEDLTKSSSEKKSLVEIDKAKQKIKEREKHETDLDKLLDLLVVYKTIKISEVSEIFAVTKKIAEEWSQILDESKLAYLHYPPLGEPEIRYIEK